MKWSSIVSGKPVAFDLAAALNTTPPTTEVVWPVQPVKKESLSDYRQPYVIFSNTSEFFKQQNIIREQRAVEYARVAKQQREAMERREVELEKQRAIVRAQEEANALRLANRGYVDVPEREDWCEEVVHLQRNVHTNLATVAELFVYNNGAACLACTTVGELSKLYETFLVKYIAYNTDRAENVHRQHLRFDKVLWALSPHSRTFVTSYVSHDKDGNLASGFVRVINKAQMGSAAPLKWLLNINDIENYKATRRIRYTQPVVDSDEEYDGVSLYGQRIRECFCEFCTGLY